LIEFVYGVTVAFTVTERADQLHHDNAPAHSRAQQSITSSRSVILSRAQICLPVTSGFSQSKNRRWRGGYLWMRRSHSTQAHSAASHCRLASPMGEWLFTDAHEGLLWLAAKLHNKATRLILEIHKMTGYFPESSRLCLAVRHPVPGTGVFNK
jgi:hypothetical protein